MINKFTAIAFILLLVSCASKGPKTTFSEVSEIKQEDFTPPKQRKYRKSDDIYTTIKSKYSSALNAESLERVIHYDGDYEIKSHFSQIVSACYEGDFKKAFNLVRSTNRKYLENPIYWNQVGTCYMLEGSYRKSLLFYNRALSLKSDYPPAFNNLGVMYMKQRDYSRALVAFKKARSLGQFSKTPRYNLANLYLNFGLYEKALNEIMPLYTDDSEDVDVLNILAVGHLMKNNPQKSLEYFKKIDQSFMELPRLGVNYSLALYLFGDKDQAKDILNDIELKNADKNWREYYQSVAQYIGVK
jgi:tetratricopeptide (TPR) repeat protein